MKFYYSLLITTSFFIFTNSSLFADQNGVLLVKKYCAECHGEDGNGVSERKDTIPKIAGFSAFFIYDTLAQFKQGDRKGKRLKNNKNQDTDMNQISKKISDEETITIALYLAKQTFIPANQESDFELAEQGKQIHQDLCNDCHGENGSSVADDAPILAGQWKQYLRHQFKSISAFERYVPIKMERKFKKLTQYDKAALLEFFARKPRTSK